MSKRSTRRTGRGAVPDKTYKEVPVDMGLFVERVGVVGITEEGDYLGMELQFVSGERATVMFPQSMFQKLMAALMAAGAAAHDERVKRHGSEANMLTFAGAEPFSPSDFEFGRGRTAEGLDVLMTRLKKDRLPVVDFGLPFEKAEQLAREMLRELAKGPAKATTVQ